MLNRFYFLIQAPCKADPATPIAAVNPTASGTGITVAHVLDGQAGDCPSLLRHQFSSQGNYPFCLAIRGKNGDVVAKVQKLLLLFFHPWYEHAEEGKPLFVYAPAQQHIALRDRLADLFRKHGLAVTVHFPDEVADSTPAPSRIRTWRASAKALGSAYYGYCLTSYSPEDIFLIEYDGGLIAALQSTEADLQLNNPVFYRLASEVRQNRLTMARLQREKAQLEEGNVIRQQLLELGSRHAEIDYILRFYKNEYEILPLWYKQVGHIIKVLQGKRNFRSLYDRKVKKYKE